ncbi:MAG: metallophosphoesterase [Pseudomonadota bacterium]|nr:metallophosphoesterase [Pseudomonadota bacterium]
MFHLMFSMPGLYVIVRFLWPLPWPRAVRIALAVLVLLGSQYHLFSRLSSGSQFAPEFHKGLILAFNVVFVGVLLLAAMQLLVDAMSLLVAVLRRRRVRIPAGVRVSLGSVALLLAVVGVTNAMRQPQLHVMDIAVPGLPQAFEGYRILQLTDVHASRLFDAPWVEAMVQAANAQQADIILITGDLIDGTVNMRIQDVSPLAALHAADGVWFSSGNHEYYFNRPEWFAHNRAALGMRTLSNAHTVLQRGEDRLVIAAVNDPTAAGYGLPAPDLEAALDGAPAGVPVVLMDHQPRNAPQAAAAGVAVQLSGHTHGGMLWGLDQVVARANNGFVRGRYDVGGMTLYVSPGTALWPGFAARLGTRNELTVIRLVGAVQTR